MSQQSEDIIIHPHKYSKSHPSRSKKKHFIFDLDETIGSFSELNLLWRGLQYLTKINQHIYFQKTQEEFNEILDLYPEFLRHGILTILEYIYYKKQEGACGNVYIYTNNQCTPPWVALILSYIESKNNTSGLFEKPICAFKIKTNILEPYRTTHDKTFYDFIVCSLLPKNSEICFIDNSYFPNMNVDRIFYIQPKSYRHSLSINEIIRRFSRSDIINSAWDSAEWTDHLHKWILEQKYNALRQKTEEEEETDILIAKKMMHFIRDFFYMTWRKPKTKKRLLKNKRTRKMKRVSFT